MLVISDWRSCDKRTLVINIIKPVTYYLQYLQHESKQTFSVTMLRYKEMQYSSESDAPIHWREKTIMKV